MASSRFSESRRPACAAAGAATTAPIGASTVALIRRGRLDRGFARVVSSGTELLGGLDTLSTQARASFGRDYEIRPTDQTTARDRCPASVSVVARLPSRRHSVQR